MPGDDDAPISSYSDPFYDRLDAMARQVKRMWWLFALGLLVVVIASIAVRLWNRREPTALGAAMAIAAQEADADKRPELWKALADGTANDPGFRAKACLELAQISLAAGDAITARERTRQAEEFAKTAKDDDLRLAAVLSQAAIAYDGKDYQAALDLYEKASRSAGAVFQARRMAAELGAAACLEKQGKIEAAIQRLEPLTTRNDTGASQLIEFATAEYWRLKRQLAEPKAAAEAKPAEAKPAEAAKPAAEAKPADAKPAEAARPAAAAPAKPAAEPAKPVAEPAKPAAAPAEPAKH